MHLSKPDRCQAIDIVRTYAMLAMLLSHELPKLGQTVALAYGWAGPKTTFTDLGAALSMVLHLATPTFALLTGFSLAFFVVSRQRKQRPAWEVDGYLLRRGLLLLILGLLDYSLLMAPPTWRGDPGILGMFGVALWFLIPLRRLSVSMLFTVAIGLAAGVQLYVQWRGSAVVQAPWLEAFLLTTRGPGALTFPVLPWLPVILVGFASGRLVAEKRVSLERLGLIVGGVLLTLWAGGFLLGHPSIYRKYPPSLDYQIPYLATAFLLLALHARFRQPEQWRPVQTVMILGRCSLFFYLIHAKVVINGLVAVLGPLHLPMPVLALIVYGLSLAILIPTCAAVLNWGPAVSEALGFWMRELRGILFGTTRTGSVQLAEARPARISEPADEPTPTSLPSEILAARSSP